MENSDYESICFQIISFAGTAKSAFLEAIEKAKSGDDYKAQIDEGNKAFLEAAKVHAKALQLEAQGKLGCGLLLIHAETILSSAETIKNLLDTIIELINND